MERTVAIDPQAVLDVAAQAPKDEPVAMLNLLRFRERTEYPADSRFENCSGRKAYFERYVPATGEISASLGLEILFLGSWIGNVIALPDERWDELLLVRYPSFAVLQQLFNDPRYQEVVVHRTAALEDSRLIAFSPSEIPLLG